VRRNRKGGISRLRSCWFELWGVGDVSICLAIGSLRQTEWPSV
jgi:hypothetical protein